MNEQRPLILGTAGHIDHGKSSLILALTGTDPDRLAEEKERGITIELGFAELELPSGRTMGVVDVPGHERFVRQMMAGASGIDVALLVIAADDGIMPQTIEHLTVLRMLGVPSLIVALTKIDLVEDDWTAMAADEVERWLADTPYADAPIVAVSSRTGQGLDELKHAIDEVASRTQSLHTGDFMRLAVDRTFSIKGAGTVVTGTLWNGAAHVDDEVEISPEGTRTRIRSIQVHGRDQAEAHAGQRTALNLSNVSCDEARPGDFVVTPGRVRTTDRIDCRVAYLGAPHAIKPLKSGARVRLALGTREVLGRLLLMDGAPELAVGASGFAQVRLEEDIAPLAGDRFILRSYSPVAVIGGGTVLLTHPHRRTNLSSRERALVEALDSHDGQGALAAAVALQESPFTARSLAESYGFDADALERDLDARASKPGLSILPVEHPSRSHERLFITQTALDVWLARIGDTLLAFHEANPNDAGMSRQALVHACGKHIDDESFGALVDEAQRRGVLVQENGIIAHVNAGVRVNALNEQVASRIMETLTRSAAMPPTIPNLPRLVDADKQTVYRVLGILEKDGRATRIAGDLVFSSAVLDGLQETLCGYLKTVGTEGATTSELRDCLGTSRKFAIPLLEYFDDKHVTRRNDDMRTLC